MLRESEQAKINCGRAHFKTLDTYVNFEVVDNKVSFLDMASAKNG